METKTSYPHYEFVLHTEGKSDVGVEAAWTSETLVSYRVTHNPEDLDLILSTSFLNNYTLCSFLTVQPMFHTRIPSCQNNFNV
jgi:hypothetical protein